MTTSSPTGRSACQDGSFHIAAYPPAVTRSGNPYFLLLHASLAKRGISVSDDLQIDLGFLKAHAGRVNAVHLHWPERFWHHDGSGRPGRVRRATQAMSKLLYLLCFLRLARHLGVQRIWTVHNVEPHEGADRWDRYGYRLLARECDVVVCHSHSAVESVRRLYEPAGRVIVMPMGELGSAYPAARARLDVLTALQLDPGLPVVACLGRLREYKQLDLACDAIERLQGRVQLIIGGVRQTGFDVTRIREAARRSSTIVLIERKLSDQEFADLMGASDAVLLPYSKITGSAALLSALGCGRGVIASDLPYFQEVLAGEPGAGLIVPGRDATVWANSIAQYLSRPADVRSQAALRLAARYSWDRCAEPLVAALGVHDNAAAARVPAPEAAR
jgi:beta-1,4-mannosyltransferase